MKGEIYRISKRFEITMTFAVFAKDETEAWDVACDAGYMDMRGVNGEPLLNISVRNTDEEVISVRETGCEAGTEDEF